MKRDRESSKETAALPAQPPPPPPRRAPSSSAFTLANGMTRPGGAVSGGNTNGFHGDGLTRPGGAVSRVSNTNGVRAGGVKAVAGASAASSAVDFSASSSTCTASKRVRLGLDPPEGWRAAADRILLQAEGGGGGTGVGVGVGDEGFSTRGGGDKIQGQTAVGPRSRRKFAAVCSANFNRSMMAHKLLRENRFDVQSYGTGRCDEKCRCYVVGSTFARASDRRHLGVLRLPAMHVHPVLFFFSCPVFAWRQFYHLSTT